VRSRMGPGTTLGIETPRGLGAHSSGLEKNDLLLRLSARRVGQPEPSRRDQRGPAAKVFEEHAPRYLSPAAGNQSADTHLQPAGVRDKASDRGRSP
jgi:hypothetical protein